MYRASYRRPLAEGIEVCTLTHAGPLPPPWLAPGFVVNLVLDGRADLVARGATHPVEPGWVVLADAGELRSVARRHSTQAVTRSLTFTEAYLRAALADRDDRASASLHFATNATTGLGGAVRALYRSIDEGAPLLTVESALEHVVDGVATQLSRSVRGRWPRHPRIRRAEELLRARFDEELSLDELARAVALSRTHLLRQFRAEFGVAPHAFQIHLRVAHARKLLARGVASAEVGAACGFFDQSHLGRHFRRLVGVTPAAYSRAIGHAAGSTDENGPNVLAPLGLVSLQKRHGTPLRLARGSRR